MNLKSGCPLIKSTKRPKVDYIPICPYIYFLAHRQSVLSCSTMFHLQRYKKILIFNRFLRKIAQKVFIISSIVPVTSKMILSHTSLALTLSHTHALTFGKSHVTLTLYSIIEFIYIKIYINLIYTIFLYWGYLLGCIVKS